MAHRLRTITALFCMASIGCVGSKSDGESHTAPPDGETHTSPRDEETHPALRVVRTFSAIGVKKIVIRAAKAETLSVTRDILDTIEISGLPVGGAKGYHSPDPNWKETPPQDRGLDFVTKAHGAVLVISTKKEMQYIHHYYALHDVKVRVPEGIEVVCQQRVLTGDGKEDLELPEQ